MTIPIEYKKASQQFDDFIVGARDFADLPTTNMAWNMVVGVLQAFRRRLTVQEALSFSDALPPAIRALFLENWDTTKQSADKFGDSEELLREVRSVRSQHNFSPENAIQAVSSAMWEVVDSEVFERALSKLSPDAREYWRKSPKNGSEPPRIEENPNQSSHTTPASAPRWPTRMDFTLSEERNPMKTPTLILGILAITCSAFAGIGSFLTQKKADWDFIQKTGGIEVVSRETKENRSYLNIRYDVSGLTTVTRKPELINSGIVVKNIKAWFHEDAIHVQVITSIPEKNKKYESSYSVELPKTGSGVYPVFYGKEKDPEKKIGVISL